MYQINVKDKSYSVSNNDGQWILDENNVNLDIDKQPNGLISVLIIGKSYTAIIENIDRKNKEVTLKVNGQVYKTAIKEPIDQLLSKMGLDIKASNKIESIKAPMPGMVLKILVSVGQQVKKGDGLIILEAMKMENILKAADDATIKAIKVTERTAVEKGAVLIEFSH